MALPAFTASLAGPHLNLPQSSSPPSSSTVALTVTTPATIMPIPSTSYIPTAAVHLQDSHPPQKTRQLHPGLGIYLSVRSAPGATSR